MYLIYCNLLYIFFYVVHTLYTACVPLPTVHFDFTLDRMYIIYRIADSFSVFGAPGLADTNTTGPIPAGRQPNVHHPKKK